MRNPVLCPFLLLLASFTPTAGAPPVQPTLIQGRITALRNTIASIKTPDSYPPSRGGRRALYVAAGPTFRVDLSRARVLFPDGQRPDPKPLAVGERIVVLLSSSRAAPPATYFASLIERQAQ